MAPLPALQPGDLLLFAGRDLGSRAIAAITCSPAQLLTGQWFSHVGIIARFRERTLLWESISEEAEPCVIQSRHVSGPQAHWPESRIRNYGGKAWLLRLDPRLRLSPHQSSRLTDFLESKLGDGYDYRDAGISGTRFIRLMRWIHPSAKSLFCSELCAGALRDIGAMDRDINPAAYNPARLARDLQWWQTYQAIGVKGSESVRLR